MEAMLVTPKSHEQLIEAFHSTGVNMRYLGQMANDISFNFLKELAVREILVLALDILIRDGLSFLIEEANGFRETDVRKCVLHYLNEMLST